MYTKICCSKKCWWQVIGKIKHWTTSGLNNPLWREIVKERTSREKAVNILKSIGKYGYCWINDENCSGTRMEVHHIDKNPLNNAVKNLACLCNTHHRIADKGSLSITELKKVKFINKYNRTYSELNKTWKIVSSVAKRGTYTYKMKMTVAAKNRWLNPEYRRTWQLARWGKVLT